jgi:hypothetical protein
LTGGQGHFCRIKGERTFLEKSGQAKVGEVAIVPPEGAGVHQQSEGGSSSWNLGMRLNYRMILVYGPFNSQTSNFGHDRINRNCLKSIKMKFVVVKDSFGRSI